MSDLDDYLAYLRYERAAAAQTITTYRRLLLQFAAAFPEENLRALDAQTLKDYLLRLTKEHKYSAATLNQHRAALRGYYGWLHCQRGLADDPSTHLKLPRKSKRPLPEVLTPEQITTLLTPPEDSDPLKLRDHAILELFYSAGLRLAELAALNADLPEANGHTIVRGKGGVERLVFIGSKAREALARWRAVRSNLQKKPQETALFLNKNGTRISERGIALPHTPCATPSPPTSCNPQATSAPCKKCSAIKISRPRKSIPTSTRRPSSKTTTPTTRVRRKKQQKNEAKPRLFFA